MPRHNYKQRQRSSSRMERPRARGLNLAQTQKQLMHRQRVVSGANEIASTALRLLPRRRIPFLTLFERGGRIHAELVLGDKGKEEFTDYMRRQFYAAAREECGLSKQAFREQTRGYDVHHKRPKWVGGDNEFDNLVLIDRDLHTLIHREIDQKFSDAVGLIQECNTKGLRLKRLYKKIETTKGLHLSKKGVLYITAPWPESKVCIPASVIRQEFPQQAEAFLNRDSSHSKPKQKPTKPRARKRKDHRATHSRR